MARILIAGCGDIGTAVGRLLAADGHEVFGVRRSAGPIAAGITPVVADLCDRPGLCRLPDAVQVLIYAAAADRFDDEAYERAYVTGLRNVLGVLDPAKLQRAIFVSSTSVYHQDNGDWVDESCATLPAAFSGKRLLQGEAMASAMASALNCASSVVRFGGIYGPGRTRLIEQVRSGASCQNEPVQWTNRIHRDDCARVLHHLTSLATLEPIYLGVDSEPAGQCDVMRWLARELGAPEPVQVPATDHEPRRRRGGNKRCSNRRLLASGYSFVYPDFRRGYTSLLREAVMRDGL